MTLLQGEKGCTYTIRHIYLEREVKRRLEMLGMTKGTKVLVLNKKRAGAVIIKVRGTRFAMGQRFAVGIEIGGEAQ